MNLASLAFLISCASFVVAGMSLGWQVLEWLLSAGRAKGVLLYGVQGRGGVVTKDVIRSETPPDQSVARSQGFLGPEIVGIRIVNVGRAPIVVEKIEVCLRGVGMAFRPMGDLIGEELPCSIPPGANSSWYTPWANGLAITSAAKAEGHSPRGVYLKATLGTGASESTKGTIFVS